MLKKTQKDNAKGQQQFCHSNTFTSFLQIYIYVGFQKKFIPLSIILTWKFYFYFVFSIGSILVFCILYLKWFWPHWFNLVSAECKQLRFNGLHLIGNQFKKNTGSLLSPNFPKLVALGGGGRSAPLGFFCCNFFLIPFVLHNQPWQLLFWCNTNYGKLWKNWFSTIFEKISIVGQICPPPPS